MEIEENIGPNLEKDDWDDEFDDEMEEEEGEDNENNDESGEEDDEGGSQISVTGYENKKLTKRQWMSKNSNENAEKFHMQLPDKKPRKKRTLLMTEEQQIKKMEKVLNFFKIFIINFFLN